MRAATDSDRATKRTKRREATRPWRPSMPESRDRRQRPSCTSLAGPWGPSSAISRRKTGSFWASSRPNCSPWPSAAGRVAFLASRAWGPTFGVPGAGGAGASRSPAVGRSCELTPLSRGHGQGWSSARSSSSARSCRPSAPGPTTRTSTPSTGSVFGVEPSRLARSLRERPRPPSGSRSSTSSIFSSCARTCCPCSSASVTKRFSRASGSAFCSCS